MNIVEDESFNNNLKSEKTAQHQYIKPLWNKILFSSLGLRVEIWKLESNIMIVVHPKKSGKNNKKS